MKLLVATRSSGKMPEIRRILSSVPDLEVVDLKDVGLDYEPEEDELEPFATFEENALSKARHFAMRSGLSTVADDSGIEVDALGGRPGVRTKRFAEDGGEDASSLDTVPLDEANNRHLMASLQGVPLSQRTARYVCVAVLLEHERAPLVIRGEAPGVIVEKPRGSGGFGYDPYMLDPEMGKTFAEMSPAEKDSRSHRGNAFRALAEVFTARCAVTEAS